MQSSGGELAEVQAELQTVKKALRDGGTYLSMTGETLQRYLLQLNEKENLLISRQLQSSGDAALLGSSNSNNNGVGAVAGGAIHTPGQNSSGPSPTSSSAAVPVKALDRDRLESVLQHMQDYETLPLECARALRALSSLAYADAQGIGMNESVLQQILRILQIHPDDAAVQLCGMRALCNMAYEQPVAEKRLTSPEVMAALLWALVQYPEPKDAGIKASEAVARIIAAEMESSAPPGERTGALGCLFLAACRGGGAPWQSILPGMFTKFASNEVVECQRVAQSFASVGLQKDTTTAVGWLSLAKLMAVCEAPDLPQLLVDAGAIATAAKLMEMHPGDGQVQLTGIEAMSSLVGNRWSGLVAFAEVGGMTRIEEAMRRHGAEPLLQTKGIRALSSGVQWPDDIQRKSNYSASCAVELTKSAMVAHGEVEDLQLAAMEALAKYLEKSSCLDDVKADGGHELVKSIMARHASNKKLQHYSSVVLKIIEKAS